MTTRSADLREATSRSRDTSETAALVRAARDAERECAESRERAETLVKLQRAITLIAAATSEKDIIALTLGAARTALGFDRALWLDKETGDILVVKYAADGSDIVESSDEVLEYDAPSGLAAIMSGSRALESGDAGELGAPIVDVRRWYALVPILRIERHPKWVSTVIAVLYADGHPSACVQSWQIELVQSLVSVAAIALQNLALLEEAQTLASRDPLTGLYNRRAFGQRLEMLVTGEKRLPFVLAMIDVDNFKSINDTRGHAVGDAVLKRLARTLLASSRVDDVVGRFAGDEFVVILSTVEADDADTMLERLSMSLRSAGISCSIGGARFPRDGTDIDALLLAADTALYCAKAGGKNRHSIAP